MNTTIYYALDTRRVKKDGTYPIVMRINHNRSSASLATGLSVCEGEWNSNTREIRPGATVSTSVTRLNNSLNKRRAAALDLIMKKHDEGRLASLSVQQVKSLIVNRHTAYSIFEYGYRQIKEMELAKKYGNARMYRCILSALRKYVGGADLTFNDISYSFLKRYESVFRSRGGSTNGFWTYAKVIRALFNRAIKEGFIKAHESPFIDYRISPTPTKKRAISISSIKAIMTADVSGDSGLLQAQDIFILSFSLMGANFKDLALLKVNQCFEGRVRYTRAKTGHCFDILIPDVAATIISKYSDGKNPDDYLLPIVRRKKPKEVERDIEWGRKIYNRKLKELGIVANVNENLTSYVSRHSFASIAKGNGVPVSAISEMLGHNSIRTTQIYLTSLSNEKLDSYQAQVLEDLVGSD